MTLQRISLAAILASAAILWAVFPATPGDDSANWLTAIVMFVLVIYLMSTHKSAGEDVKKDEER